LSSLLWIQNSKLLSNN